MGVTAYKDTYNSTVFFISVFRLTTTTIKNNKTNFPDDRLIYAKANTAESVTMS